MAEKLTLIIFSGDMDKALAALNLAVGASSTGMEVSMFFTFWGLNLIKKDKGGIKSRGVTRRMLNFMNRGGASRLPLSRFHMFGLGKWMMGKLMKNSQFPSVNELLALAHESGVKFIACTTSMAMMGLSRDAFIPEVDSFAGVPTYLAEARDARVNLFI